MMFMFLGLTSVLSQKSKVTTGALNFDQGRYGEAIEALEEGLEDPSIFKKSKHIAKGYYYLAQSYYMATGNDELLEQYPDAALMAKDAYDDLMALDDGAKSWKNRALLDGMENNLWGQIYNKGVALFNSNQDDEALRYFQAAQELNQDHFLTNRMLASAYLVKEDSASAVNLFKHSIGTYKASYVEVDEETLAQSMQDSNFVKMFELDKSQMSYVVRQLAIIQEAQGNTDEALATLAEGSELLPDNQDVQRQELAIYQAHPDLYEQAVEKFERQLENNPDDNAIRLAYASMQERSGNIGKALGLYQDAYDLDPENLQANYGLAAMRINMAAELSEEKMDSNDDDEIKRINGEIKTLCEEAYPYLVWLHEAQPDEPEWLSQLVNITPLIGKTEEMTMWAEKLGKLRRGE